MAKPPLQEDPVWSILPSYDMYQYTFYGQLDPPEYGALGPSRTVLEESETLSTDPTPAHSLSNISADLVTTATNYTLQFSAPESAPNANLIVADESHQLWRETVLDNIHNLRNFSSTDNPYTNNVSVSVLFTAEVGEVNVEPRHIDPLQYEFKQGDYLHGYVLIKNNDPQPMPFDMFYVLFEGNLITEGAQDGPLRAGNVRIKKFLELYEFAASWNQSEVNRLLSEKDSHFTCRQVVDPRDGAYLKIQNRCLAPNTLYKRFFTFRIPDKLLDTECSSHNLSSHTTMPPTFGVLAKEKALWNTLAKPIVDFPSPGLLMSYEVLARFIGKALTIKVFDKPVLPTKLINESGDEYIILKESTAFVRVVPETHIMNAAELATNNEVARLLHENLVKRAEECIENGKQYLQKSAKSLKAPAALEPTTTSDDYKERQLYTRVLDNKHSAKLPQDKVTITIPVLRKKMLLPSKCSGVLQVSTPSTEYLLNYLSPKRFCAKDGASPQWTLEVPIDVTFIPNDELCKAPKITSIIPELAVATIHAGKRPIPVELTPRLMFRNPSREVLLHASTDNFENIVSGPMRQYAKDLAQLATSVLPDEYRPRRGLVEDVLALAAVKVKCNNLVLRGLKAVMAGSSVDLESRPVMPLQSGADGTHNLLFKLMLDATKAQRKTAKVAPLAPGYSAVDEFCLVPSFQSCYLSRMYFLRLYISFSTDQLVELKVPLTIVKMPLT